MKNENTYWTNLLNRPENCQNENCESKNDGKGKGNNTDNKKSGKNELFPAPKSKKNLRQYIWLCKACVRKHNEQWNYKEGLSNEQVEKMVRDDVTWGRKTKPFATNNKGNDYRQTTHRKDFKDPFGLFDDSNDEYINDNYNLSAHPKHIQDACKVFEINTIIPIDELKEKYKLLVKKYHPDVNKNSDDEKIKQINSAYSNLKEYIA